jgi:hypothetical protein
MSLLHLALSRRAFSRRSVTHSSPVRETGQASVEYALVLLGAALVATLLISWATSTDLIGSLFSYVIGLVRSKAN